MYHLIAQLRDLTENNQHTESLMVIARHLGDVDAVAELGAIAGVTRAMGYIPRPQYVLRREICTGLLATVEARYGADTLAAVRGAL